MWPNAAPGQDVAGRAVAGQASGRDGISGVMLAVTV
jgi:hypothetical protein